MPQFIFTMKDLRKVTPQGKEILKGIWLSFYGDAKIGVLGANGAGKSTLLRIMAGVDKDFAGEAFPAQGTRIGYLQQEPVLDHSKNVLEHVMEAVAEKKKIVLRYEEISANYSDDTADEFARLQDQIGPKKAKAAWLRSVRATNDLVALVSELGIDCACA